YVAQAAAREQQLMALRGGMRLGLVVSLAAAVFVLPFTALGAVVGVIAVIPGTLNAYWLGQQRRGAMLQLAVASALLARAAALAAGILSLVFLPQLAAARSSAEFNVLLARAAKLVLIPSAIVFAAFYAWHRSLLAILYEPSVVASDGAVALLLAGSWVRI